MQIEPAVLSSSTQQSVGPPHTDESVKPLSPRLDPFNASYSSSNLIFQSAILPVCDRVFAASAKRRKSNTSKAETEVNDSNDDGDTSTSPPPHRSNTTSLANSGTLHGLDERSTMARRQRDPAVPLATLERMRLVFELHDWREQRKKETPLSTTGPRRKTHRALKGETHRASHHPELGSHHAGIGKGRMSCIDYGNAEFDSEDEEDIAAMLQWKQRQQEMEMRLRATCQEMKRSDAPSIPFTGALIHSPGIPFQVFERKIVEPFFDFLFPPIERERQRVSRLSFLDGPRENGSVAFASTMNSSLCLGATNTIRMYRAARSSYQRRRPSNVEAAENLFRVMDTNGDGFLSWDELSSYILQSGQRHLLADGNLGGTATRGESVPRTLTFAPLPTNVSVWQKQYPLVRYLYHSQPITKLLPSNYGHRYVTVSYDGLVKLWRPDPCLSDERGKPALVHERNLFASGSPILDAVLSTDSLGDSEVAVVLAMDGTVTVLRVGTGEVLKTFIGRCFQPNRMVTSCVSSTNKQRRTWRKDGQFGGMEVSEDIRTALDSSTAVLRPTFKVRAYRREAIDIFFSDVSRYFSGLGVVAPTYEHLERRRVVKADVLETFGGTRGPLGEWTCGAQTCEELQNRLWAVQEDSRSSFRTSTTFSASAFGTLEKSSTEHTGENVSSSLMNNGNTSPTEKSTSEGERVLSNSNTNDMISSVEARNEKRRRDKKQRSRRVTHRCKQARHSVARVQTQLLRQATRQAKRMQSQNRDSETCWFACAVALGKYEPTSSASLLPSGIFLFLGFETGVLQLYRMRLQWFTISGLASTRVEPPMFHSPALSITLHMGAITSIIVNESNDLIFTASDDGTVTVRHLSRIQIPFVTLGENLSLSGMNSSHISGHSKRITCICWSNVRGILATGGADRFVILWLPSSSRPLHKIDLRFFSASTTGCSGQPVDVSFLQPPHQPLLLLVLDSRRTMYFFDVATLQCLRYICDDSPMSLRTGSLLQVRYDATDDRLVLGGKYLRLWDTGREDEYPHDYRGHRRPLVGIAYQRHWGFWVSADDSFIIIWNMHVTCKTDIHDRPLSRPSLTSEVANDDSSGSNMSISSTIVRSWSVERGVCCFTIDQTESSHIFVVLLREQRILEYNSFSGTVLRFFDFPAHVGDAVSLACSIPPPGPSLPASYPHASPLSFICGTFEKGHSKDGTTALYSLTTGADGALGSSITGSGVHRCLQTSGVGVSYAVIVAALGLVIVGHRGGISVTPVEESTTCPIPCLRLTDRKPKSKPGELVSISLNAPIMRPVMFADSVTSESRPLISLHPASPRVSLSSVSASAGFNGRYNIQGSVSLPNNSRRTSGHCRANPPLDLVAFFPGPLMRDPVAVTRECMLHRERYLFHDDVTSNNNNAKASFVTRTGTGVGTTTSAAMTPASLLAPRRSGEGEHNNIRQAMEEEVLPPLLLFSEEFTATASSVGSTFGIFLREQLATLGYVVQVTPLGDSGYVATGSDDGLVQFWNARTMSEVMRFRATYTLDAITAMEINPESSRMIIGDASGYILLLDLSGVAWQSTLPLEIVNGVENGISVIHRWRGHRQGITSVRFVGQLSSPHPQQQRQQQQQHNQQQHRMQRERDRDLLGSIEDATLPCRRYPPGASLTVPPSSARVKTEHSEPHFLCTCGEDTYIYTWHWEPSEECTPNSSGTLYCIGCFGGGAKTPPDPPLGKLTDSAWRVMESVRQVYVTDRLMALGGPLSNATALATNRRTQIEKAAVFLLEDLQSVRRCGAWPLNTNLQAKRWTRENADKRSSRRSFARDFIPTVGVAKREFGGLHHVELTPSFVLAFEEGLYYDRSLTDLLARFVSDIVGAEKVVSVAPDPEKREAVGSQTVANAVTTEQQQRPPVPREQGSMEFLSPMDEKPNGVTALPQRQASPSTLLPNPDVTLTSSSSDVLTKKSAAIAPTRAVTPLEGPLNSSSTSSGVNGANAIRCDASFLQKRPSSMTALRQEAPSCSTVVGKGSLGPWAARSGLSLPVIRPDSANVLRESTPFMTGTSPPTSRSGTPQPKLFAWDQKPPVAVYYASPSPLPRLRQGGGGDAQGRPDGSSPARVGQSVVLPLLSQVMPRPGEANGQVVGSVEKVLVKEKEKQQVVQSKFVERQMIRQAVSECQSGTATTVGTPRNAVTTATTAAPTHATSNTVHTANTDHTVVTSVDRNHMRRERKRKAALWAPARVMGTLMSWKSKRISPNSTMALRARRILSESPEVQNDESQEEIPLPSFIPLTLGLGEGVPSDHSNALTKRPSTLSVLAAEVEVMRALLQETLLEKQFLVAEERTRSPQRPPSA